MPEHGFSFTLILFVQAQNLRFCRYTGTYESEKTRKKRIFYTVKQNVSHALAYGFSPTRVFPYKDRIFHDSVLILENTGHRKPVFWYTLRCEI